MRLKDLLVVLDATPRSDVRLALALDLARRNDAHLTGLCPLELLLPSDLGFALGGYPEVMALQAAVDEVQAKASEAAQGLEARFREALRREGVAGDWRSADGPAAEAVAFNARHADLTVLGQPDPEHPLPPSARSMVADTLMTAGRPLLVIPYAGSFPSIGRSVLIAWTETREAARAAGDALALIDPAASVTVLTISPPGSGSAGVAVPGAEIAAHLARHGLTVSAAATVRDASIQDADVLLSYAADLGADLLVMGGYGHSRVRELALGGVTRDVLRHMTLPVLISH